MKDKIIELPPTPSTALTDQVISLTPDMMIRLIEQALNLTVFKEPVEVRDIKARSDRTDIFFIQKSKS